MWMQLAKKIFSPKSYFIIFHLLKRKLLLIKLATKKYDYFGEIEVVWRLNKHDSNIPPESLTSFSIFNTTINLNEADWHKDPISGYQFKTKFIREMNLDEHFDQGIDVKFPWELSRFYFAVKLAQAYHISKDIKYYEQFKQYFVDWKEKNPFLYGVNWICTMEVAIRATNLIVAKSLFWDVPKDTAFDKELYNSLIQHGDYIHTFPEKPLYKRGHSTNHTVADYAGLLFISLALKDHVKGKKWQKCAISNLEQCIAYQVRSDGGHFESSIPYHGLVLEFFAYSAIACVLNDVKLSDSYWHKLASMFRYTASYVDLEGNAPLVGDNDSGHFLIFDNSDSNHYYLLSLGKLLFGRDMIEDQKDNSEITNWIPDFDPKNYKVETVPREGFLKCEESGVYVVRNKNYRLLISLFPLGMGGQGGHNHIDTGSICVSVLGKEIIVDPGTVAYTRNLDLRKQYRSPEFHNFIYIHSDSPLEYSSSFWDIKNFPTIQKLDVSKRHLSFTILDSNGDEKSRKITFDDNGFLIEESASKPYTSVLHLSHFVTKDIFQNGSIHLGNLNVKASYSEQEIREYFFFPTYDFSKVASKILLHSQSNMSGTLKFEILQKM